MSQMAYDKSFDDNNGCVGEDIPDVSGTLRTRIQGRMSRKTLSGRDDDDLTRTQGVTDGFLTSTPAPSCDTRSHLGTDKTDKR